MVSLPPNGEFRLLGGPEEVSEVGSDGPTCCQECDLRADQTENICFHGISGSVVNRGTKITR